MFIKDTASRNYSSNYRTGVKIANYNEDIFGRELQSKYVNEQPDKNRFITESMDRFIWPKPNFLQVSVAGNEITKPNSSNYDLNLELYPRKSNDYIYSKDHSNYVLENKNKYLPNEIISDDKLKRLTCSIGNNIHRETQNTLNDFHIKDTSGIFNTKTQGLSKHLLFGHSLDQNAFHRTDMASTYELTMNRKERTDKLFNPKYTMAQPQFKGSNKRYDNSDWDFRKFKIYNDFTKHYDQPANLAYKK